MLAVKLYLRWDQGLILEQCVNLRSVNHIILIINEPACGNNLVPSLLGVLTRQNLPLDSIPLRSKLMDTVLWNGTPRTWTCAKVANICYQNSAKRLTPLSLACEWT